MKCPKCGAKVKSGSFCPKCGEPLPEQPKKKFKWWYILVIIAVIGVISSLFGNGGSSPQKVDSSSASATSASASVAPSPSETEKSKFGVGESVKLNDITVTFNGIKENSGSTYNKPKDGDEFVICSFTIENGSSRDITVSSMMSFEAYVDDFATSESLSAQITSDESQLDGSVAAGKKMAGAIGYEVPKTWKSLEISFTPDFWSGKDITFVANNK